MPALEHLANATGSARAQIVGIGGPTAVPFNWVSNAIKDALRDFVAVGGGDPLVNWRVAASVGAAPLEVAWEADYQAARPRLRSSIYDDYAEMYEMPFGCQTNLLSRPGMLLGLALLRDRRDGETTEAHRAMFAAVAPHVRSAVLTQIAVEAQGAALITGSLDAMQIAAFVCDASGKVRAHTAQADECLQEGLLRLSGGALRVADRREDEALQHAIARAAAGVHPLAPRAPASIVVNGEGSTGSLAILDVVPLPPRPYAFGFEPRALVVVRGAKDEDDAPLRRLLVNVFRLTDAEADVALRLARGDPREVIAAARGASLQTVKSQLQAVFAKLGVRREVELVARLSRLARR